MEQLETLIEESHALHGHLCPGQVLGVRLAALGCNLVGIQEPRESRELLVWAEIDRCATDAIQSVTGCKLGKRTLKFVDYGKVAATFLNTTTSEAFRVVARDDSRQLAHSYAPDAPDKKSAQLHAYKVMPDDMLFNVYRVEVSVPDTDLPGRPLTRVMCAMCDEGVNDGREVERDGEKLCRACADGTYYRSR